MFNVMCGEAMCVQQTPYGSVGLVHSGEGIELVWLSKQDELVDSGWFSQAVPDLIIVMQGQLRLGGDLAGGSRCRALRRDGVRRVDR